MNKTKIFLRYVIEFLLFALVMLALILVVRSYIPEKISPTAQQNPYPVNEDASWLPATLTPSLAVVDTPTPFDPAQSAVIRWPLLSATRIAVC